MDKSNKKRSQIILRRKENKNEINFNDKVCKHDRLNDFYGHFD